MNQRESTSQFTGRKRKIKEEKTNRKAVSCLSFKQNLIRHLTLMKSCVGRNAQELQLSKPKSLSASVAASLQLLCLCFALLISSSMPLLSKIFLHAVHISQKRLKFIITQQKSTFLTLYLFSGFLATRFLIMKQEFFCNRSDSGNFCIA